MRPESAYKESKPMDREIHRLKRTDCGSNRERGVAGYLYHAKPRDTTFLHNPPRVGPMPPKRILATCRTLHT